jgi:hypothetical protein
MLRLLTPVELSVVRSWTGFKPNGSSESDQKLFVLGHDMRISSEGIPRIPGLNRALVESIYFTEYRCQNTGEYRCQENTGAMHLTMMHLTMHLTEEARLFSMPPPASSAGIHNV